MAKKTYMIFMLKPEHPNAFMRYEWTEAHGGFKLPDYTMVYTGCIDPGKTEAETLEAIYTLLNIDHPADYTCRSLSVSDVVALEDAGLFYCDSFGFKKLLEYDAN